MFLTFFTRFTSPRGTNGLTATDRIGSIKSTKRQTNVLISRPSLQNRLLCKNPFGVISGLYILATNVQTSTPTSI